jgi:ABC-2 type transport system permease protein
MIQEQWIGFQTLLRKETSRVFRIWTQTLLPSIITSTLYFLIFGNFIGSRIGKIEGISYMEFIVPGLIMMSVVSTSYSNVVSSVFSTKFQRSIEELLISPLSYSTIIIGFVFGGMVRGLCVGILVTIVALFFSPIHLMHIGIIISCIFLASILFGLGGFINALFAKSFDNISIVPTFILTPLTYLGGVFYSIKLLPEFWQTVSYFNPILYLINIFRFGFLGVSDVSIVNAYIGMIVLIIVFWIICHRLLSKGFGVQLN